VTVVSLELLLVSLDCTQSAVLREFEREVILSESDRCPCVAEQAAIHSWGGRTIVLDCDESGLAVGMQQGCMAGAR
jgi:RNA polymerase subunit RPABC4/transcription elongation factor Spt4